MFPKNIVYYFSIPPAPSKRLGAKMTFVVMCVALGGYERRFELDPAQSTVAWLGPEKLEYRDPMVDDGNYSYKFKIEYSNVMGSRKEVVGVEFSHSRPLRLDSPDVDDLLLPPPLRESGV